MPTTERHARTFGGRGTRWHRRRADVALRVALETGMPQVIGAAIRIKRRSMRLTLRDLEERSGWGKSMIAYMERGERWSEDALADILAALEVKG